VSAQRLGANNLTTPAMLAHLPSECCMQNFTSTAQSPTPLEEPATWALTSKLLSRHANEALYHYIRILAKMIPQEVWDNPRYAATRHTLKPAVLSTLKFVAASTGSKKPAFSFRTTRRKTSSARLRASPLHPRPLASHNKTNHSHTLPG
jgi:hypothetical protein